MAADPIMAEILSAYGLLRSGDRTGARSRLDAIWARIGHDPEPMHECALSHYMGQAQDEAEAKLAWDVRALDAALRCTDRDVQAHSTATSTITAFMPSLHAHLGLDYLKLGDLARSREHLASARQFVGVLADNAYGQTVRRWIERLAHDLGEDAGRSPPNSGRIE